MNNLQDLKKENERLSRELADACMEVVDTRIAYSKIHSRFNKVRDSFLLHLIEGGSSLQEAKMRIKESLEENSARVNNNTDTLKEEGEPNG